jgi:hypothetical protein
MYTITKRQKQNAKVLGVTIKPSSNKNKKIDVFYDGKKIAEIGDIRYMDYDLYIQYAGLTYANERRRLYKIRHDKDRKIKGSAGYYADKILW